MPSSLKGAMSANECPLVEVLFPLARARLLEALFKKPPRPHYVRELVGKTGLSLRTVQDELRKLSTIGILSSWSNGYHRFYCVNQGHALHRHLAGLIEATCRLPSAQRTALRRASQQNKEKRRRPRRLSPIRQPHWGIFKPQY